MDEEPKGRKAKAATQPSASCCASYLTVSVNPPSFPCGLTPQHSALSPQYSVLTTQSFVRFCPLPVTLANVTAWRNCAISRFTSASWPSQL